MLLHVAFCFLFSSRILAQSDDSFPQPAAFPESSLPKLEASDKGFFDFLEEFLGLKPKNSLAKKTTQEPPPSADNDNNDWSVNVASSINPLSNLDSLETVVSDEETESITSEIDSTSSASSTGWWDKLFGDMEQFFKLRPDTKPTTPEAVADSIDTTLDSNPVENSDAQSPPLSLTINSMGIMFRAPEQTNGIPPTSDDADDLSINNRANNDEAAADTGIAGLKTEPVKTILRFSFDDDEDALTTVDGNIPSENSNVIINSNQQPIETALQRSEESSESSSSQKDDTSPSLVAQFVDLAFCQAKCIEQCITVNGNDIDDCKDVCGTSNLKSLCAQDDKPCLKACSPEPLNHDLTPPVVTSVLPYVVDGRTDTSKSVVTWNPVPGAVLYVVSFVADAHSVQCGALILTEDTTNETSYVFNKVDACFQYFVKVSAVLKTDITPFSEPRLVEKSFMSTKDLRMRVDDIKSRKLMTNEGEVEFAEITLDFTSRRMFDMSRIGTMSFLRASECRNPLEASKAFRQPLLGGKFNVLSVQYIFLPRQLIIRLPVHYARIGCFFEYNLVVLRNRCLEEYNFVDRNDPDGFDSLVRARFILNCGTIDSYGCTPPEDVVASSEVINLDASRRPVCHPSGFSVDVLAADPDAGKFNVTLSWITVVDDDDSETGDQDVDRPAKHGQQPDLFVVRHGAASRPFLRDSSSPIANYADFDPEADIVVPGVSFTDTKRLHVKLNRPLGANELHVFQVCAFWQPLQAVRLADWPQAPRFILDMAAFPTLFRPRGVVVEPPPTTTLTFEPVGDRLLVAAATDAPRRLADSRRLGALWPSSWLQQEQQDAPWLISIGLLYALLFAAGAFTVVVLVFKLHRACTNSRRPKPAPMIFVGRKDSMKQPIVAEA